MHEHDKEIWESYIGNEMPENFAWKYLDTFQIEKLRRVFEAGQRLEREAIIRLLEIHRLGLAETSTTVRTLNRLVEKIKARGQQEEGS